MLIHTRLPQLNFSLSKFTLPSHDSSLLSHQTLLGPWCGCQSFYPENHNKRLCLLNNC